MHVYSSKPIINGLKQFSINGVKLKNKKNLSWQQKKEAVLPRIQ